MDSTSPTSADDIERHGTLAMRWHKNPDILPFDTRQHVRPGQELYLVLPLAGLGALVAALAVALATAKASDDGELTEDTAVGVFTVAAMAIPDASCGAARIHTILPPGSSMESSYMAQAFDRDGGRLPPVELRGEQVEHVPRQLVLAARDLEQLVQHPKRVEVERLAER